MTFPRRHLPVRVVAVTEVCAGMRQIDLTGPDVSRLRFHTGAHVVVRLPARRVYSIWSHRPRDATLSIRIALHQAGGPGCSWALTVEPGDRVTLEAPRSKLTLDSSAAFHLFAGDETGAVPLLAMRAALHRRGVPVVGVFETVGAAHEMPDFDGVPGLPWVHRGGGSAVASRVLLRAVRDLTLPAGSGVAYVAGESETCRLIQRHLVEQRGFSRRAVRLQPQWAAGRAGFGAGGASSLDLDL